VSFFDSFSSLLEGTLDQRKQLLELATVPPHRYIRHVCEITTYATHVNPYTLRM
jgi:hypothetical protein